MSENMSEGIVGSVTDRYVTLNCGCRICYLRGNLDKGQMIHKCAGHINEHILDSLRIVEHVASRIKRGKADFNDVPRNYIIMGQT